MCVVQFGAGAYTILSQRHERKRHAAFGAQADSQTVY